MKLLTALALVGCVLALVAGPAVAQPATFTFESATVGTNDPPAPFTVNSDSGVPVAMTVDTLSPDSQFGIADNNVAAVGVAPIANNILFGVGPTTGEAAVKLSLDKLASDVSFDYAISGLDAAGVITNEPLTVGLGLGAAAPTTVATLTGADNGLSFFQGASGLLSLGGGGLFDTIYLTGGTAASPAVNLGIDNLTLTAVPAVVPEPGTFAFALASVLPLALRLRRRR